ncbi:MAG TPA: BTAD domain-containing putative transcriptional regulator [Acidimicrobiales bacterium]|nr:BTAD domain-containing putative transcriptional regulator [Acidimicrobiales bacterium]
MTGGAQLNLLGPVELLDGDGRPVPVGGPTQRAVLALLALHHDRVVSVDQLLEGVWGGDGPASGVRALQSVISRLRAALTKAGAGTIDATGAGYVLRLDDGVLDLSRAERAAPGDAVRLWRGEALAEFADLVAFAPDRLRLAEWHWSLVEQWGDELVAADRPATIAAEWERHVGAAPARTRLWAQLMEALAALDRQADALRVYQRARTAFADLGLDPPADLVALERSISRDAAEPGVLAFLFTDVVGSTQRWEADPVAMAAALAVHDDTMRAAVEAHNGRLLKTKGEGDSTVSVFTDAADALRAAVAAQRALEIPVRMAVHMGPVEARAGDYFGPTLNRAARLRAIAHGGQVICSRVVATAAGVVGGGIELADVGSHRLKDLAEPEFVHQVVADGLAREFPPLNSLNRSTTNLPAHGSSFIGREAELARVAELIEVARLVTLTGAGGSGKTRLAQQAGAEALDRFPDGVWFAELAPISDPATVPNAVALAIGLQLFPGDATAQVVGALSTQQALVILDNCEHVVEGAAAFASAVLAGAPNVQILASSRERLRVSGETAWPVPTLALPADRAGAAASEAVRLFAERAQAASPGFVLDDTNLDAVVDICRRVDAIPLAIELAAARVRVLPPKELLERLSTHRDLLTGGDRGALPRHRSLRATIDWSHSLLSPVEQLVAHRLAVFRGGWTLAAAEHVVSGEGVDEYQALDIFQDLVDKSLVSIDQESGRYHMLETVREYCLEQLEAGGDADGWRRRHAEYVVALLTQLEDQFVRPKDQPQAYDVTEAEHDNMVAALTWAFEHDRELAGQLVGYSFVIWYAMSEPAVADWCGRVTTFVDELTTPTRMRACLAAGTYLGYLGQKEIAAELLAKSRDAARQTGDAEYLATALTLSAAVHRIYEELEISLPFVEEALTLVDQIDRKVMRSLVLGWGSWVLYDTGHHARAADAVIAAYELCRELDDHVMFGSIAENVEYTAPGYMTHEEIAEVLREHEAWRRRRVTAESSEMKAQEAWEAIEAADYAGALALQDAALALPQTHWRFHFYRQFVRCGLLLLNDRVDESLAELERLAATAQHELDRVRVLGELAILRRVVGDYAGTRAALDEALLFLLEGRTPVGGWGVDPMPLALGSILMRDAALGWAMGLASPEKTARQFGVGFGMARTEGLWVDSYELDRLRYGLVDFPEPTPDALEFGRRSALDEAFGDALAYAFADDAWRAVAK